MKDTISMTIRRPSMEVRTPESYEESGFYDELHEVSTVRAGSEELLDLYGRFFDEKLKPEETRKFVANAFRDGTIKTTGTEIDKLMPPVSRFGGGGRAQKKQGVIDKLKGFFDKFFGIGGSDIYK